MSKPEPRLRKPNPPRPARPRTLPELFQIVIECQSEAQQRELFERFRSEGLKVRLLVL
jgi:hypothetical protein